MKYFQIHRIVSLILISTKGYYTNPLQIPTKSLGKNVNIFLDNFQSCHIKYFVGNENSSKELFDVPFALIKHFQDSISVSVETLDNPDRSNKSHHDRGKFTSCFVHWYMVNQLGLYQQSRDILQNMKESEVVGEVPDYFIFYEDHNTSHSKANNAYRKTFYTKILASRFLMGPIFCIQSLQKIYLVCIPCQQKDPLVQVYGEIFDINNMWKSIYTDLQGAHISPMKTLTKEQAHSAMICDGFADKNVNMHDIEIVKISTPNSCVHRILSRKLNYTFGNPDNLDTIIHGHATNVLLITPEILDLNANIKGWRWLPYATKFNRFYFITVVKKPGFYATMLIQPFTLETWSFIIICGVAMCLVTQAINNCALSVVNKYRKDEIKNFRNISTWKIFISIIASVLDQATDYRRNLNKLTALLSMKFLSFTWFSWLVVALQIGMFYKGVMFSFVTKPADPNWPETIDQLVVMPFHIITLSTQFIVGESNETKSSLLKDAVLKVSENSTFQLQKTYNELQEKVFYYNTDFLNFAEMVLSKKRNIENFKEIPISNLAFIDQSLFIHVESALCTLYMPNNVVSQPKSFPGYLLVVPWAVGNTYFQPIFENYLAKLYESGIEYKMNDYLFAVHRYMVLKELSINLDNLKILGVEKPMKGQLLFMSFQEMHFQKGNVEESAIQLSFEMLKSVFVVCLVILISASILFCFEKLKCK